MNEFMNELQHRLCEDLSPSQFDSHFRVNVLAKTPNPQTVVYGALHQDYSAKYILDELPFPSESKCGEIAVTRCLSKHHYGILEHPQITFLAGGFSHSVMVQARTHRIGISFDVASGRYTSQQYIDVFQGNRTLEEVIYFRPVGRYRDRSGKDYLYTEQQQQADKLIALSLIRNYVDKLSYGMSEEHARGMLPYDVRQNFVVSMNLRTLCHVLDLRHKADAQVEIQMFSKMLLPHFADWCPEIYQWYQSKRLSKGMLAP